MAKEPLKIDDSQKKKVILNRLDMSFGELLNMYKEGELIIRPEYQRAFRWDSTKQSAFIESILLDLPIPSIFVYSTVEDNTYELLDGLQRLSTVFAFMRELKSKDGKSDKRNGFRLKQAPLLPELVGKAYDGLHIKTQRAIKRRYIRMDILSSQSSEDVKYEFFKRINSNSERLSDQEMRNCIYHGEYNSSIVALADEISGNQKYVDFIFELSDKKKDNMYLEELILRYYAFADTKKLEQFNKEVKAYSDPRYLDYFMQMVNQNKEPFIKQEFLEKIELLDSLYEHCPKSLRNIFRNPNTGHFTRGIYDCIMQGLYSCWDIIGLSKDRISHEKRQNLKEKIEKFKTEIVPKQYKEINEDFWKPTIELIDMAKEFFSQS